MTNRQLVSRLRELGHRVEVYVRKDGSIRITSLDGVKYSSRLSEGIRAGRDLLRTTEFWSKDEEFKVASASVQRAAARASRASGDTLRSQSTEFQSAFKRFQKEVKRINKRLAKEGKRPSFGVNWRATKEGARRAGITVEQQLRRAMDYFDATSRYIAPPQMVEALKAKIELFSPKFPELKTFSIIIKGNERRLDIYEVDKTLNWIYGYVQGIQQSETLLERAARLRETIHTERE